MDREEKRRSFKRIYIQGIVQGIGFRPFVYRLAKSLNIYGWVKNTGGSLEICCQGEDFSVLSFIEGLYKNDVKFSYIEDLKVEDIKEFKSFDFKIIDSDEGSNNAKIIPPDLAICKNCILEIEDENNRRFNHFFNTCVSCGPRFTVIERLPYDRVNTSMEDFKLCHKCEDEYTSQDNRRFHAETISCRECGPYLIYETMDEKFIKDHGFNKTISHLKQGNIIAIKGIGGFHFACMPQNKMAVKALREIKGRDKKPFALMFKDVEEVKKLCDVSSLEEKLLTSNAHPIVILKMKKSTFEEEVLFGDLNCGCFLPYTPLHHLIMNIEGLNMLIMTSSNLSGSPIIKDDDKMLSFFKNHKESLLKGVLYNQRRILRSVDDSVVQIVKNNIQVIRRSRGYVPNQFKIKNEMNKSFLTLGGDLKACFSLVQRERVVLSQYLGDLEDEASYINYINSIEDFKRLFSINPEFVVCDMHPGYFSSKYARELGIYVLGLQHHHAHIASVMAEHEIYEPCLGVSFDGTGFGLDETIWGGEFLLCDGANFKRIGHLKSTKILGKDSSAIDSKKTAICFLNECKVDLKEDFDDRINIIKASLNNNFNTIKSSSMGRLFDAVSSLLDISHENGYEGECAILLQREAEKALNERIKPYKLSFDYTLQDEMLIADYSHLIKELYMNSKYKKSMALGFHIAVANMVKEMCLKFREKFNINKIAMSGGVFQNKLLTKICIEILEENNFKVYINNNVPTNDGGIALGQAYIGGIYRCV